MNEHLQNVTDGEVQTVNICRPDGKAHESVPHEIYWPFAIARKGFDMRTDRRLWVLTHLPSGYFVCERFTKRECQRYMRELRSLPDVDWTFKGPKGKKWDAAKPLIKAVVKHAALRAERD